MGRNDNNNRGGSQSGRGRGGGGKNKKGGGSKMTASNAPKKPTQLRDIPHQAVVAIVVGFAKVWNH